MKNVDSVDQDQTSRSVQSDLELYCPQKLLVLLLVGEELMATWTKEVTSPNIVFPRQEGETRLRQVGHFITDYFQYTEIQLYPGRIKYKTDSKSM